MKNLNKQILLDLIRFTPGGISRAELARQMDLTRSAVSSIVNDLSAANLVIETDTRPASGGRRPIMLEINPRYGYLAGVDLGASHMGIFITDFATHVLEEVEYPIDVADGPERCLALLAVHLDELLSHLKLTMNDLLALGIGVPGPVITEAGAVGAPPLMPGWDEFPIRDRLQGLVHCPVALGNDAELGAIGEWAYGAGRNIPNLVYIKVGNGVGAGLLLDGSIYRGAAGSAGEIGHTTIEENGPLCTCGNYGCLEAIAGGKAIARMAGEAVKAGKRTQLSVIAPEQITARDVADSARRGDLVAQQIVMEAGGHLGVAVASLVNVINPNMVVMGGGVSQVGDLLLEPIRKAVRSRSLASASRAVRITSAMLSHRSTGMGAVVAAANLALERVLCR